jgi:hypothetical protein
LLCGALSRTLKLGANRLIGPLPDLSGFTALTDLFLASNRLTGTIPTSIDNARNLRSVSLSKSCAAVCPPLTPLLLSLSLQQESAAWRQRNQRLDPVGAGQPFGPHVRSGVGCRCACLGMYLTCLSVCACVAASSSSPTTRSSGRFRRDSADSVA